MATLIVSLPLIMPGPGTEFDYVLTIDGLNTTRHGRATASLLPPLPGAVNEIVAVVPARALSWHRVDLPKTLLDKGWLSRSGQSAQLRAALEGLLEEQLLDEPASLHFALAPEAPGDRAPWVAVCDRVWLSTFLQIFEQARRPFSRIVPEFAPTALDDDAPPALHVTAGLESAQLILADTHGVTTFPLGSAAATLLAWPESAAILAEPSVANQAEQLFKRPVTLQSAPQRWLQAARSAWNLAQLDLASSSRTRTLKNLTRHWNSLRHAPQWRAARWMAGMLLATQLIGLSALAWQERAALAYKQAALRETLLHTFPDVKVVLDAPLQMEREVIALQQATGAVSPRDLEPMLIALSTAAPANQALSEIEFTSGEARVKGLQLQADEATKLETQLQTKGYAIRSDGDGWLIRMEIAP